MVSGLCFVSFFYKEIIVKSLVKTKYCNRKLVLRGGTNQRRQCNDSVTHAVKIVDGFHIL